MISTPDPAPELQTDPVTHPGVQNALALLLEGHSLAQDVRAAPWEFAVDLTTLTAAGGTPNVLRWLLRRGYVELAVVPSRVAPPKHHKRPATDTVFPSGSCFFLTGTGVAVACASGVPQTARLVVPADGPGRVPKATALPVWDEIQGRLLFLGQIVKRFHHAASNQRTVLRALNNRGWLECVSDPLPRPANGVNVKQRLHDTIKNLNRGHEFVCLHFYGADGGRAVGWKLLPVCVSPTEKEPCPCH
jgi:hypothetical protein